MRWILYLLCGVCFISAEEMGQKNMPEEVAQADEHRHEEDREKPTLFDQNREELESEQQECCKKCKQMH